MALLVPLSQASPREFVAVRSEVAAELKAAGHVAEAARIRKLRRPAPSVWATNALARDQPNAIAALLTLGKRVRADEAAMLAGGDGRGFIDEARALRKQAAQLSRRAEAIAKEAGVALNAAAGRRIAQTLQAAAAGDDATRAALAAGQLTADLTAPSAFGGDGHDGEPSPSDDATRALSAAPAASAGGSRNKAETTAIDDGKAYERPEVGRPEKPADDVRERTRAVAARAEIAARKQSAVAARAEVVARKQAAAARVDAAARRKADAVAARAKAAAQRRTEDAARTRAAADSRRLAAAEREVVARRRVVERARAAVGAAEDRLRAAKDALAAAETTAETVRRRAAD